MKQSRALVNLSKAQGFDPTRIYDQTARQYTGDKFIDYDPMNAWDPNSVGQGLIGELPAVRGKIDPSQENNFDEKVTWNAPDAGRERPIHKSGSDPTPDRPGA